MLSLAFTIMLAANALTFDGQGQSLAVQQGKEQARPVRRATNNRPPPQAIEAKQAIEPSIETHWLAVGVPVTVELKNGKIVTFRSTPSTRDIDHSVSDSQAKNLREQRRQLEDSREEIRLLNVDLAAARGALYDCRSAAAAAPAKEREYRSPPEKRRSFSPPDHP